MSIGSSEPESLIVAPRWLHSRVGQETPNRVNMPMSRRSSQREVIERRSIKIWILQKRHQLRILPAGSSSSNCKLIDRLWPQHLHTNYLLAKAQRACGVSTRSSRRVGVGGTQML